MHDGSPFHVGEQRVQSRLGVRDEIEPWARKVVRPVLPEQHRDFYAALPFVVMAARDAQMRPWVTLLADEPGFLSSSDPGTLRVAALPSEGDALAGALDAGEDVGFLGIELHSRRRNRVNGSVAERDTRGFTLAVDQAYGNCPQYISERCWQRAQPATPPEPASRSTTLTAAQRGSIERADTFFIATGYREGDRESETFGMDASHRGGAPGFVQLRSERHLVFPDYAGNNHFNTIGNLLLDPRVGLLFVDFEGGDLLQLTGRAKIDWDSAEVARFSGARRLVEIEIEEVVELRAVLPIRWESTGGSVRELRVVDKKLESADVVSLHFEARDGDPLPVREAGQYLPLELEVPGQTTPVARTYSLSNGPDAPRYRISVKRQSMGVASRFLHDHLEVGTIISASSPRGDFVLHIENTRPVMLVSAGVGLTPMVSMLHALVAGAERPVWFAHGARDGDHHPLRQEVEALAAGRDHVGVHVAYSRPRPEDVAGRDYQSEGRIDADLLEKLVPGLRADFYVCGPTVFMAALQSQLEERGVSSEHIHSESFGPAS